MTSTIDLEVPSLHSTATGSNTKYHEAVPEMQGCLQDTGRWESRTCVTYTSERIPSCGSYLLLSTSWNRKGACYRQPQLLVRSARATNVSPYDLSKLNRGPAVKPPCMVLQHVYANGYRRPLLASLVPMSSRRMTAISSH